MRESPNRVLKRVRCAFGSELFNNLIVAISLQVASKRKCRFDEELQTNFTRFKDMTIGKPIVWYVNHVCSFLLQIKALFIQCVLLKRICNWRGQLHCKIDELFCKVISKSDYNGGSQVRAFSYHTFQYRQFKSQRIAHIFCLKIYFLIRKQPSISPVLEPRQKP